MKSGATTVQEAISQLPRRSKIHCFMGSLTAYWPKKKVIEVLEQAEEIAWVEHGFHHNLAVVSERMGWDCVLYFDVQKR